VCNAETPEICRTALSAQFVDLNDLSPEKVPNLAA
jgi:hypothetical protein